MTIVQREHQLTLPVEGMNCASGVAQVEGALKRVPGVSVNLAAEKPTLEVRPEGFSSQEAVQAVHDSGYKVPTSRTTFL